MSGGKLCSATPIRLTQTPWCFDNCARPFIEYVRDNTIFRNGVGKHQERYRNIAWKIISKSLKNGRYRRCMHCTIIYLHSPLYWIEAQVLYVRYVPGVDFLCFGSLSLPFSLLSLSSLSLLPLYYKIETNFEIFICLFFVCCFNIPYYVIIQHMKCFPKKQNYDSEKCLLGILLYIREDKQRACQTRIYVDIRELLSRLSTASYNGHLHKRFHYHAMTWASYQIRKNAGCICAANARNVFPVTDFKGNR